MHMCGNLLASISVIYILYDWIMKIDQSAITLHFSSGLYAGGEDEY